MTLIAPSILSSDFSNLSKACNMINNSQADYYHIDVMDGVFVPNITFGMPVIKAIKPLSTKPFDVHLMIEKPERYLEDFKDAGADILTVHYEACLHLDSTLTKIKTLGMKAGVAINPHTSVECLEPFINKVDIVLIMSVNPGFGGQSFIPYTLKKVKRLKEIIVNSNANTLIEIDGGVSLENHSTIVKAGVDVLVAGNAVFSSQNPQEMIQKLKQ